jgi:prephenate dehydrogenase
LHGEAEKIGAVDETRLQLRDSVTNADMVLICQPISQSIETLEIIAQDLKPECVVMDTSSGPASFLKAAASLLPENVFFLSFVPAVAPQYLQESTEGFDSAHADLFKNSTIAISSSTNAPSDAIQLATDLASLLGANALYSDPHEISGLLAASETLPQLAGAALLNAVTTQPGWHEGRKMAGSAFALTSHSFEAQIDRKAQADSILLEQQNNLRVLDNYMVSLTQLRELLAKGESKALEDWLASAGSAREEWLSARVTRQFEHSNERIEIPTIGETFGRLLGFRKRKPKSE